MPDKWKGVKSGRGVCWDGVGGGGLCAALGKREEKGGGVRGGWGRCTTVCALSLAFSSPQEDEPSTGGANLKTDLSPINQTLSSEMLGGWRAVTRQHGLTQIKLPLIQKSPVIPVGLVMAKSNWYICKQKAAYIHTTHTEGEGKKRWCWKDASFWTGCDTVAVLTPQKAIQIQ